MRNETPITDVDVHDIANRADVCERSVLRRLSGLPVRGRAGARIDRILNERIGTPDADHAVASK